MSIYLYIFGGTSIRQTRRRITGSTAEVSVSIKAAKTIPEKRIETKRPPVRDKGAPEGKRFVSVVPPSAGMRNQISSSGSNGVLLPGTGREQLARGR